MRFLPDWVLTNKYPAFHDVDSVTAIEQTAKVYGAMNELIKEHNEFIASADKKLKDLLTKIEEEHDVYNVAMRQEFQDFINIVDLKIQGMQNDLKKAIAYMQTNLEDSISKELETMIMSGAVYVGTTYNADEESLTFTLTEEV